MSLILYPLVQKRLNNKIANEVIPSLWQENAKLLPQNTYCYGVYFNYESDNQADYDFAIATEQEVKTTVPTIEIEDLSFYEVFRCKVDEIYQTWQLIWKKEQQGLLKRAYTVDFEKYYPDNSVAIYISVVPHC
ncbi:effector binding domain-containing protein [Pasteurella canis]|uniref:GyrI-like domain-containing protein n=1 Tax=Pasteurella canis TaxID=753 RepID=UPI001E3E7D88|nr:effector binding domain-containing protein [Pasteurella canis]UEA17648.1 effector binding domain-containing protein [Pasteurella canis]